MRLTKIKNFDPLIQTAPGPRPLPGCLICDHNPIPWLTCRPTPRATFRTLDHASRLSRPTYRALLAGPPEASEIRRVVYLGGLSVHDPLFGSVVFERRG